MGGSCAEVGANQRGFEIVQRGAVDLLPHGDDLFDALGQVLARARDGFFHALDETWFLFFVQTAKKGLNHEVSDNDYRRIPVGDTESERRTLLALGLWLLAKGQIAKPNRAFLRVQVRVVSTMR